MQIYVVHIAKGGCACEHGVPLPLLYLYFKDHGGLRFSPNLTFRILRTEQSTKFIPNKYNSAEVETHNWYSNEWEMHLYKFHRYNFAKKPIWRFKAKGLVFRQGFLLDCKSIMGITGEIVVSENLKAHRLQLRPQEVCCFRKSVWVMSPSTSTVLSKNDLHRRYDLLSSWRWKRKWCEGEEVRSEN